MATKATGPVWVDHVQGGVTYSMTHLHPRVEDYEVPAIAPSKKRPGRVALKVKLRIEYSHHCFTRDEAAVDAPDPAHYYNCSKRPHEVRVFCIDRWNESLGLPTIVAQLGRCYFTGRDNFFVWRNPKNPKLGEYFVFFKVELRQSGAVALAVQSAYPRTDGERLKKAKATTLNTLVANAVGQKKTYEPR